MPLDLMPDWKWDGPDPREVVFRAARNFLVTKLGRSLTKWETDLLRTKVYEGVEQAWEKAYRERNQTR